MTHGVGEQLSAFLDNELPEIEEKLFYKRLQADAEVRDRLSRFAVIGQLLRDEQPVPDAARLSQRISAALGDEAEHVVGSRWPGLIPAGVAAAAGLVVLTGLLSLGTSLPEAGQAPTAVAVVEQPQPATAADAAAASGVTPLPPSRLTSYLVAHGDYAGGLSRQVLSSHVVNGSPDFNLGGVRQVSFDE